jgi:hypothetical protein
LSEEGGVDRRTGPNLDFAESAMKPLGPAPSLLLALLLVGGCASGGGHLGDEEMPQPGRIIVYDFAASPADLPADSAVTGHYEERTTPQTAEEVELGRRLGDRLAAQLVRDIRAMGLAVERAGSGLPPQAGDLVIRGEFVSIDEGSRAKRMLIGFGAGSANLQTLVEVYQVTATGCGRSARMRSRRAAGGCRACSSRSRSARRLVTSWSAPPSAARTSASRWSFPRASNVRPTGPRTRSARRSPRSSRDGAGSGAGPRSRPTVSAVSRPSVPWYYLGDLPVAVASPGRLARPTRICPALSGIAGGTLNTRSC